MILIGISLMTNNVEHILMYLLDIYVFLFDVSKTFTHF